MYNFKIVLSITALLCSISLFLGVKSHAIKPPAVCPIFRNILTQLQPKTDVPIRLPSRHCNRYANDEVDIDGSASRNHYNIIVGHGKGCEGQASCYVTVLSGTIGRFKPDSATQRVRLSKHVIAYIGRQTGFDGKPTDDISGVGYGPYIFWQQGNAHYELGVKDNVHTLLEVTRDTINTPVYVTHTQKVKKVCLPS